MKFAGFGAEVLSTIVESEAFYKLKAPVKRLGAAFCPIPSAPKLEAAVLPSAELIEAAALEIVNPCAG